MFVFYKGFTKNGILKYTKNFYIRFRDHLGRLQTVPAFPHKALSEELGRKIEQLIYCKISGGNPDADVALWLESLSPKLSKFLIKCGLLDSSDYLASLENEVRTIDRKIDVIYEALNL